MKYKLLILIIVTVCVAAFSCSCSIHEVADSENVYEVIKMERMVQ